MRTDLDFDALAREVLENPDARTAYTENGLRRRLAVSFEQARKEKDLSIRDLAKAMHSSVSEVQRLLHHEVGGSLTLRTVCRAANALGKNVSIQVRDASLYMPRDEALLNGSFGNEILQRRCDLALWYAVYDEALVRVARYRRQREDKLRILAEVAHRRPGWEQESEGYRRHIDIVSTSAYRFSVRLATDIYADSYVSVNFHLREDRGVGVSYTGNWSKRREPAPLSFPARPDAANRTAAAAISDAMRDLSEYIEAIPDPSDYEEPEAPLEEDSEPPEHPGAKLAREQRERRERAAQAEDRAHRRQLRAEMPKSSKGRSILHGPAPVSGKKVGGASGGR